MCVLTGMSPLAVFSSYYVDFTLTQFDPEDADVDLGLPVSNTEEFRLVYLFR